MARAAHDAITHDGFRSIHAYLDVIKNLHTGKKLELDFTQDGSPQLQDLGHYHSHIFYSTAYSHCVYTQSSNKARIVALMNFTYSA